MFSASSGEMGTFDEEGNYTPREITSDDLGMSFADAIDGNPTTTTSTTATRGAASTPLNRGTTTTVVRPGASC